jgi:hypothetical protein
MKLSILSLLLTAGLAMAATIEVGSSQSPSSNPWCGS